MYVEYPGLPMGEKLDVRGAIQLRRPEAELVCLIPHLDSGIWLLPCLRLFSRFTTIGPLNTDTSNWLLYFCSPMSLAPVFLCLTRYK